MANSDAQDRNLPASEKKISKAREEGQIARSRDLVHFLILAVMGWLFASATPWAVGLLRNMLTQSLRFDAQGLREADLMKHQLIDSFQTWAWIALPAGLITIIFAVGGTLASGGLLWTLKTLAPKFDKFNPLSGIGRLFSKDQLIETGKSSLIALALGAIGWWYLSEHISEYSSLLMKPLPTAITESASSLLSGWWLLILTLALCAVIDVPLQRWRLSERLKMSREEVKQEHKESDGNPEMKGRMKARMREMSNRRMLQAVPSADLVVMNPTHYAVALKYEEGRMAAPRVIAKGADLMAMRIRDTAQGAKVPVLQAPVLARALYAHAELDREIPLTLYSAVAQVLAYVYQLQAAMKGEAPMPGDLPHLNVPPELDPHHQAA